MDDTIMAMYHISALVYLYLSILQLGGDMVRKWHHDMGSSR